MDEALSIGNQVSYSETQMTVKLLNKSIFENKNFSFRGAISKERKKYNTRNTRFWGNVHRNVFEIQKYKITIRYIQQTIAFQINNQITAIIDLITYWLLWHKKNAEKIYSELESFSFSSNKQRRRVFAYFNQIKEIKLRQMIKSISSKRHRWAITYSLPLILYDKLIQYYSIDELKKLGWWFNLPAPKYIWINNLRDTSTLDLEKQNINLTPVEYVENAFLVGKGRPIQHLGEFNKGKIMMQDLGAIIMSQLVPKIDSGKIIDLCASPGNKTIQLINKFQHNPAIQIFASDLPGSRFQLLTSRVQFLLGHPKKESIKPNTKVSLKYRDEQSIKILPRDATNIGFEDKSFDLVIIDAPCTGSGTLSSKPDTRAIIDLEFIQKHVVLQKEILAESHRILKKGGYLLYITCSLLVEENEAQIQDFREKHNNYQLVQLHHELADNSKLISESIRLFPPNSNCEGFFACLLQREV